MRNRVSAFPAEVFLVCALVCTSAFAQGTSQINGVVKDSTGAVLPGVEITATQTATNQTRDAISDETGAFVLPNLVTGPYKVEATLPGFRTFVRTGIVLGVDQNPTINIELAVGQVTEQVEVQANVTMVETRNLGIRQVIENQEILELPLNGRNALDLILLQGGAVASGGTSSTRALQGGVGVSVGGLAAGTTTYTLDGALHTNPYDNFNLPVPFPNALGEFSVQSGAQNASNGFQGGAQVGAVTKSGTNQIHGDVFDFYRNDRFQARGYFATTKGSRTRNQVGGTIGAPIIKNKLFVFGGYQYSTNSSNPTDSSATVPTTRMLSGDFSEFVKIYTDPVAQTGGCRAQAINNTGTGATPGFLRLTDSPNFINPARFSKAALAIVHLLPQVNGMKDDPLGGNRLPLSLWADNKMQPGHGGPVGTDECGRVFFGNNTGAHDAQIIVKLDYQRSEKHQIFGRVFLTPQITDVPALLEQKELGFLNTVHMNGPGQDNLGSFYTIGDTYLLSPNTVNSLSFAVNRTAVHRTAAEGFDVTDVGIDAYTYLKKTFYITGAGFNLHSATGAEASYYTTTGSVTDTLNVVRGSHQMSFGGTLQTYKVIQYANVLSVPGFTFGVTAGDPNSTGLVQSDFLLGKFQSLRQSAPSGLRVQQWYLGMHAQDTFRVTPRFTLNAGLRYEPFFPQQQKDGHIYTFSYDRMLNNVRSQTFVNAPPGFYYPGDPGFQGQAGMDKSWKNLGPRIGFGWDPAGDGKMSIRASYGLSFSVMNGQFYLNTNNAPPFGNDNTASPTGKATFDNPWADFPGGSGFAPGVSFHPYDNSTNNRNIGFAPSGLYLALPSEMQTTSTQSWNLTLQRQMPAGIFLSLQYTGNNTHHLWNTWPMNPAIYVDGTGLSTGGCMVPDGKGGTQSILVAAGTVTSLAAARTSTQPCSSTTNTNFRRILQLTRNVDVGPYVSVLDGIDSGGNGNYNGLVVSVRRNATRNLNLSGNYTWSHCLTNPGSVAAAPNVNTGSTFVSINGKAPGTWSNEFFDTNGNFLPGVTSLTASRYDRRTEYNNCDSDRRQRVNTTAVVSTPQFGNRLLRMIAGGWKVSSIYTWSAGSYLSVASGSDIARIGGNTAGQMAIQLNPDVYTAGKPHGPRAQYLNPSTNTFIVPETGRISPNLGRNNIQGPPSWQWDASLARTFDIGESQRIELRAEAYNVTNSFHPGAPSTNLTNGTFGQINSAANNSQRDMQFALRYIF